MSSDHPPTHDKQHDPAGVDSRFVLASAAGLAMLIGGTLIGMYGMHSRHESAVRRPDAAEARRTPVSTIMPQLSVHQHQQRRDYEAEQQELLSSYGWVDESAGVARVPIERAMQILAQSQQEKE